MNLGNAGFSNRDVKEIRFFCTEKFSKEQIYWHFKSINDDVIQVAMNGNQVYLRSNSLQNGYIELPPPYSINGIYKKRVYKSMLESTDVIGIDSKGGFTITPFGMKKFELFWTIKGNSENYPKYECASKHDYLGGYANSELSPAMVETHHTIWFRGEPPEKEVVQNRLLGRLVR